MAAAHVWRCGLLTRRQLCEPLNRVDIRIKRARSWLCVHWLLASGACGDATSEPQGAAGSAKAGASGQTPSASQAGAGGVAGQPGLVPQRAGAGGQSGVGGVPASSQAGAAGAGGAAGTSDAGRAAAAGKSSAAGSGGGGGSGSGGDYHDDFDTGAALDLTRYEITAPNCMGTGTIAMDTSAGHSGQQALRVQGGGGYCNHVFLRPKLLSSPLPQPLYVRVFVKSSQPLAAGHVTFVALRDQHENKDLRLGGQNQVLIWNRESDDATLPELSPTGVGLSAALRADTWQCLEFAIDSAARSMNSWLDGTAVAGLALDAEPTADVDRQWQRKTDWSPELADLRLGWESYGDQSNTLWFDDLAVAKTRIGCE
ncbi:MAG: hypothetical protein RL701_6750 [Pseudomonadota bacterium]